MAQLNASVTLYARSFYLLSSSLYSFHSFFLSLFLSLSSAQYKDQLGRGNHSWENVSIRVPWKEICGMFSWSVLGLERTALCGWCLPAMVILGDISKQAGQAMRSNPVCSVPPWPLLLFLSSSRFLSELLSWIPFMVDIYLQFEKYVCFSEVIFGQYSITARRKKAKTPDKTAGHQSSLVRQISQFVSCSVTEQGSMKTKSRQNSEF